jgi:hypothetical protein
MQHRGVRRIGRKIPCPPSSGGGRTVSNSHQLFVSGFRKALVALADSGRQVIVISQVPMPPPEFFRCITRARFKGWTENGCAVDEFTARTETEESASRLLAQAGSGLEAQVQIVHPYEDLCGNGRCKVQADNGRFLYMGDSHLSPQGARLLEPRLERRVVAALSAARQNPPLPLAMPPGGERLGAAEVLSRPDR